MPATGGALAGVTPAELTALGAPALLACTYDLDLRPGCDVVAALGGAHRLLGWGGPILADSGVDRVLALANPAGPSAPTETRRTQPGRLLRVDDDGLTFTSSVDGGRRRLTPESSVALQDALGADLCLALDLPTAAERDSARAMARSLAWARRGLAARARPDGALFAVLDEAGPQSARREVAATLAGLPFGGVAARPAGAAPDDGVLDALPDDWPRLWLGEATPDGARAGVARGFDLFTGEAAIRDARAGRVYTPGGWLSLRDLARRASPEPIDPDCGCPTCGGGFSRGYLRHLFAAGELLAPTLACLHNLHVVLARLRRWRAAMVEAAAQPA